jgi:hypothetical protein
MASLYRTFALAALLVFAATSVRAEDATPPVPFWSDSAEIVVKAPEPAMWKLTSDFFKRHKISVNFYPRGIRQMAHDNHIHIVEVADSTSPTEDKE